MSCNSPLAARLAEAALMYLDQRGQLVNSTLAAYHELERELARELEPVLPQARAHSDELALAAERVGAALDRARRC